MFIQYNPTDFKLENTSVWSFKERGNWATHKGDYRGNCPPQVLIWNMKYISAV